MGQDAQEADRLEPWPERVRVSPRQRVVMLICSAVALVGLLIGGLAVLGALGTWGKTVGLIAIVGGNLLGLGPLVMDWSRRDRDRAVSRQ